MMGEDVVMAGLVAVPMRVEWSSPIWFDPGTP
jgi:hypothetical protein